MRSEIRLKNKRRSDPNKITLIRDLKRASAENNSRIWALLASELSRSNRRRVAINLSHLNRVSSTGDILLIPGKVLGAGSLDHQIKVAAESFSDTAEKKIKKTGGHCLTIEELLAQNPKGSNVRIIK